jgi:hypothetical protein
MQFTPGTSSLSVTSVGRVCLAGNAGTHQVKFTNATTGVDVTGGMATVNMAGCTAGQFIYTALPAPITLQSGTAYYLSSQEVAGGDMWYDEGGVTVTSDAAAKMSASYDGSWTMAGGANTSYVPPNFEYSVVSGAAFITSYAGSDVRNNYAGFVGTEFTVGSSPVTVTAVGRLCLAGNSATHTVKFANASTGADVTGGSAVVNMAGCTAGQFVYATLSTPITLTAGGKYDLASLEASGGDTWYDYGTIATTSAGVVTNSIYNNGSWISMSSANTSYGPPNFQYHF